MKRILLAGTKGICGLAFAAAWLWMVGAARYSELPGPLPWILALALLAGVPALWAWRRRQGKPFALAFVALFALVVVAWQFKRPTLDRTWVADMRRDARITIEGNRFTVHGLRDLAYRTPDDFALRYQTRTYDLNALRTVDFMVERFHAFKGLAHTLLSFGFDGGDALCISVEVRREVGESFGPVKGLYKQFELMYVLGTERDLIGLRTNYRKSRVWLYPIRTTPERKRALLLAMLRRADALQRKPEFYNTVTSSCTTNIADHVVALVPTHRFDWRLWLPGYSASLVHDLGLIDTALPFAAAQARFRIDDVARQGPTDASYSARIRSRRQRTPTAPR